MSKALKKYLSIFFLTVFLFPQADKALHDLEHAGDFHCTEKVSKHFHEQPHVCKVCDYVFNSFAEPAQPRLEYIVSTQHSDLVIAQEEIPYNQKTFLFLLRGPPIS